VEKPKVILIGGAPLVGKTTVARKLAARLEYSCLSTDDLIQAVIALTTEQSHPHLHLLEHKDDRQYFITHSVARLVADAQIRNQAVWPAVKKIIMNHGRYTTPIIVEGWALMPEKVAQLEMGQVASLWLVASPQVFEQRVRQESEFFRSTAMEEVFIRKFIDRSTICNDNLRKAAGALNLPLVEVAPQSGADEIVDFCLERMFGNEL
jgi:2-phosphoglycerate kinase